MDEIEKQIAVVDGEMTQEEAAAPEYERQYQVIGNSKVPVSKSMGMFWKQRCDEGKKYLESRGYIERWDECVSYYQNDQGGKSGKRKRLGEAGTGKDSAPMYSTENIVFANVSALIPSVYAKNPDVSLTAVDDKQEQAAKLFERLLDNLINRKIDPGINLKPKMRRMTIMSMLTNIAYIELGYTKKEQSSEETVSEIEQLSKELAEAKDIETIKEIEGKLLALEEKVSFLRASGPTINTRHPRYVIADPDSEEADLSDTTYLFVGTFIRTSYLRAVYGKRNEKGEWLSLYEPTHVLPNDNKDMQGHDEDINNFTLLDKGEEHTKYGYKNKEQFDNNCRTLVWYVWDRTTKRVLMFHDKDWAWPIWVWDDPYNLSRFFPVFGLSFYTDPIDKYARSEVMYYLDQQDEINTINNERARMRHWVMTKLFVDKNVFKDVTQVQTFLNSEAGSDFVHGIDLPEGKALKDVLGAFPAPSTQYEQLFDIKPQLEAINRLSSVTPVLQSQQYKTNTTNKAIESYESTTQTRLDEKIDAMEELMADIAHALLEMCVQFMDEATVIELLGAEFVASHGGWRNMTVEQFNSSFNLKIVGGSTLKPTSKVKKELAMQLGQILGQFASASPAVVVVMLKMIERAFGEDVVITQTEWQFIFQSVQSAVQSQTGPEGGAAQGGAEGAEGGDPNAQINAAMEQVSQLFDNASPEIKQQTGQAIAQGVPLKQIVATLVNAAQGQQQQQQPQQ